jgi:hypothetical protein
MKTLKASVYANMVELDGNLVSLRSNGRYTIIAKVGASSSLISREVEYTSANSRYRYNEVIKCNGILLGVTEYRPITVDGGSYTYTESQQYITHLAI